jgi:5-methylcytosine-specific restriction protein A
VINRYELDEPNLSDTIWNIQGSGKQIPPLVAQALEAIWGARTGSIGLSYPDEMEEGQSYPEGAVKHVSVNRYERDANARLACLEKWGYECSVCNLHLELFYGPIGKSYIHVHHLKLISTVGENYKVDPINELRPVCPNCHAMLHQKSPPLTIEELQKRVSLYGRRLN